MTSPCKTRANISLTGCGMIAEGYLEDSFRGLIIRIIVIISILRIYIFIYVFRV